MLHQLLPHTISSDVREGVQIKLPPPYQPLQYACRSRGNGGQGTAVVIRRDAKSLLTLDLHCNITSLDMTLHSCKSSHNVLHLHVLCHAIVCTVYCMCYTCVCVRACVNVVYSYMCAQYSLGNRYMPYVFLRLHSLTIC